MNYFNLGEVFSFLEDLITLGQDIGSYGLVNTVTRVLGHPASGHLHSDHAASFSRHSFALLSVPLSLGFPSHFACGSCSLPIPVSITAPPPILFWYEFCEHWIRVVVGMRNSLWH